MIKNILGSLVFVAAVFVLISFIGDIMVNPETAANQNRVAETPPPVPVKGEAAAAIDVDAMLAQLPQGDPVKGQKQFRKACNSCHTAAKGQPNRTGPNLWAVVGRDKAAMDGFRYSSALQAKGGDWSEAALNMFIAGPRTYVPDTKMTYNGLKNPQARADVLAYLKTLTD